MQLISSDNTVGIAKSGNCVFDLSVIGGGLSSILREDTASIDLTGDGANTPLKADVKISAQSNNMLSILSDGLFVSDYPVETDSIALNKSVSILETDSVEVEGLNTQLLILNPSFKLHVKPEFIHNAVKRVEVRFTVGEENSPQQGDTTFVLRDCSGNVLVDMKLDMFREREHQVEKAGRDFTYNATTGQIVVTNAMSAGEDFVIQCVPKAIFEICELGTTPTSPDGTLLINDVDGLLINDTDLILY